MNPIIYVPDNPSMKFGSLSVLAGFIHDGKYMIKTACGTDDVNAMTLVKSGKGNRVTLALHADVIPVQLKITID